MLYPIAYSVPEELIVPYVPFKTCHTASHAYQFTQSEPYLKNYRNAIFGKTCLKCGWDAFRHYEILSQGTIPLFENLQGCPKQTLCTFPKEQVLSLMEKYGERSYEDILKESSSHLYEDIDSLLRYTRDNLTTRKSAEYILSKTETPGTKRILYLHNIKAEDYLCSMLAHGFLRYTEGSVDIYPQIHHVYDDFPSEQTVQLYGKGFNYTRHIPHSFKKQQTEDEVWANIRERKYDHIICFIHCRSEHSLPFQTADRHFGTYYHPREISLVCGRDCDPYYDPHRAPNREWWIRDNHNCPLKAHSGSLNVFVREFGG